MSKNELNSNDDNQGECSTKLEIINQNTDEDYLRELSKFYIPSITVEELKKEPYNLYTRMYCEMSNGLNFFRGYVQPNPIQRAKIYRAINICSKDKKTNNFLVFASTFGLIIKYRGDPPEKKFDHYLSQSDNYVFVPDKCDQLDMYDYTYYRRLISDFCTNEHIPGEIVSNSEQDNRFLFISLIQPLDNIKQKWNEYILGGVYRSFTISPEKLASCFQVFPWEERIGFKIKSNLIEVTVKSHSRDDFQSKIAKLKVTHERWESVDLDMIIQDEHEAFGVARILAHICSILPLIKTNRIYVCNPEKDTIERIQKAIKSFDVSGVSTEGLEIFSQDPYENMSFFRKASLIEVPDSVWYSFLDLYQSRPNDPHTRKELSLDFLDSIDKELKSITGPFLYGFPPIRFEPNLITKTSDPSAGYLNSFGKTPTISFYIQLVTSNSDSSYKSELYFFWQIPDLRETKYASITMEAIQTLASKWSDRSIFQDVINSRDIHLIFLPKALYVFEKSSIDISSGLYPQDEWGQSERLREQVCILKSI